MPAAPAKPRRVWRPRPSAAARARILTAVRELLTNPEAGGWTRGYAVAPKQLAELLADVFTPSTVYGYLSALAAAGDLRRAAPGLYQLPPARPDRP